MAADGRARAAAAPGPAVPLAQRRATPTFDDFLAALCLRPAQDHPARAARRAGGAGDRGAHRRGDHRGALGRLLRLLHGHGLPQVGPPLPEPPVLLADRRADGRSHPAGHGAATGRAVDRRRAEPDGRRHPLRPQLGRDRGDPVPALRALLLPGHRAGDRCAVCSASRPGRRASTRSRAATCPPPSTPPTGSPTRACASPWRASSTRSAKRWRTRWRSWKAPTRPSATTRTDERRARTCRSRRGARHDARARAWPAAGRRGRHRRDPDRCGAVLPAPHPGPARAGDLPPADDRRAGARPDPPPQGLSRAPRHPDRDRGGRGRLRARHMARRRQRGGFRRPVRCLHPQAQRHAPERLGPPRHPDAAHARQPVRRTEPGPHLRRGGQGARTGGRGGDLRPDLPRLPAGLPAGASRPRARRCSRSRAAGARRARVFDRIRHGRGELHLGADGRGGDHHRRSRRSSCWPWA